MRRFLITFAAAVLGVAAMLAGPPAGARALTGAAGPNGAWGKAEEVPGTAALNKGGDAEINSVSCASAGNCSAGGFYESSSNPPPAGTSQAFVVTEASNS
jgi:hypothetical protein